MAHHSASLHSASLHSASLHSPHEKARPGNMVRCAPKLSGTDESRTLPWHPCTPTAAAAGCRAASRAGVAHALALNVMRFDGVTLDEDGAPGPDQTNWYHDPIQLALLRKGARVRSCGGCGQPVVAQRK